MKKILLILFVAIVFINVVSAEPSYIFKQNEEVDLKVSCFKNDYSFCAITTTCNLTIIFPNNDILIDNELMTNNVNYFNYTLSEGINSRIGEYPVSVSCEGTYNGFSTFTYEVTETGESAGNYRIAIYIIIILAWLLFIIGAYKAEYTFIGLSGIIMLVFGVYVLTNGLDNFDNTLTIAFGGIHALFGGYLMIRSGWEQYKDSF